MVSRYIIVLLLLLLCNKLRCSSSGLQDDSDSALSSLLDDKLPIVIRKINEAVNRLRCPKGWHRLGGTCYYFSSNITATVQTANQTCSDLYIRSRLMKLRTAVELVNSVHLLKKYNLSALLVDINTQLIHGKKTAELLIKDNNDTYELFTKAERKYRSFTEKVFYELRTAGFKREEDDLEVNNLPVVEEKVVEEKDEVDTKWKTCDILVWNTSTTNNSELTTFILRIAEIEEEEDRKIVCSLSNNLEESATYHFVCEHVLDFCFANLLCGKHGSCTNTLADFKCTCSFLYGGDRCDRFSAQGKQIISLAVVIVLVYLLIRTTVWDFGKFLRRHLVTFVQGRSSLTDKGHKEPNYTTTVAKEQSFTNEPIPTPAAATTITSQTSAVNQSNKRISDTAVEKPDLWRTYSVYIVLGILFSLFVGVTSFLHLVRFQPYGGELEGEITSSSVNRTVRLVRECIKVSDHIMANMIFSVFALLLTLLFSLKAKRLIPPVEPFSTASNRFTTAAVFGILAFEVLKIFEELLFSTSDVDQGVIFKVLQQIGLAILVGCRYYPILASLQLSSATCRCFAFLYVLADIAYTIYREGSCMGLISLPKKFSVLDEATLRLELGTWFIIYGVFKNIPHYLFLSYIGAELSVRFIYESICRCRTRNADKPVMLGSKYVDEYTFSTEYAKKLFKRQPDEKTRQAQLEFQRRLPSPPAAVAAVTEAVEAAEADEAVVSKLAAFASTVTATIVDESIRYYVDLKNYIYRWDEDFHFTAMILCTYTVAAVFLYYLAWTLAFLYITRTFGYMIILRDYVESLLNLELVGRSFHVEIAVSAVASVILVAVQLLRGLDSYKKHKKQLIRGFYEDVLSRKHFSPQSIAAQSVHYSGFLVAYMAWGFIICFHLIFLISCFVRLFSARRNIKGFQSAMAFTVSVILIYVTKRVIVFKAGEFLFISSNHSHEKNKLSLTHPKTYAMFIFFNFFVDCFLGIASCIIRLLKATLLNIVYMSRLDHSFLGRPLDKHDVGYAAYISYLHMEVTHTHPIKLAFCYQLYDDIKKRPPPPNEEEVSKSMRLRKKRIRTRWCLAYIIIKNCRLFDLRKQVHIRLARLCSYSGGDTFIPAQSSSPVQRRRRRSSDTTTHGESPNEVLHPVENEDAVSSQSIQTSSLSRAESYIQRQALIAQINNTTTTITTQRVSPYHLIISVSPDETLPLLESSV